MDTQPLTPRQKQVLELIRRNIAYHGRPPSLREIAGQLKISGHRAVQKHVAALEKKGYLRKEAGARGLESVGHAFGRTLPILGEVAAGKPLLAEEHRLGGLLVDPALAPWKDAFLLKIKGESMKDAGILEGDLVLIKPQPYAEPGDIVVAMADGEATVKRLVKQKNRLLLKPENPAFDLIPISEADESFRILGKVMGVFRLPGI